MKRKSLLFLLVSLLVLSLVMTGCDSSTDTDAKITFPEKPINLIVWGSPGGGSDIFGRTLAKAAEEPIGQPIVVENKPGGGGATAMAYLSNQKPNGYTMLAVTTNLVLTPLTKGTPNTFEDFDPLLMIGKDATMTVARVGGEIQSLEDLVKVGKEKSIKWGTFGMGTTDHVAAALFEKETGIKVDYVPFDGGGEAMASLLGGHIDLLNGNPSEVASQLKAGQLMGIGVFSPERLEDFNDVPTYKEFGNDIIVETWRGIVAPKDTPEEVKSIIFDAFSKALDDPTMVDYFKTNNIIKSVKNGDEFYSFIEEQHNFFNTTLTEMGIIE